MKNIYKNIKMYCLLLGVIIFGSTVSYISNQNVKSIETEYELEDYFMLNDLKNSIQIAMQSESIRKEINAFLNNQKSKNFYIGSYENKYEYLKSNLPELYNNIGDLSKIKMKSQTTKSYGIRLEVDADYNCILKVCDWSMNHNIISAKNIDLKYIVN